MWDLLRRDPGTSSAEKRAIVQAAGRTGTVSCGGTGRNGTLVRLADGRDAVLTSAHACMNDAGPTCDLTTMVFMPNTSLHAGGRSRTSSFGWCRPPGTCP